MKKLEKDWLTQDHIDFEYKKYVVLAYLQDVEAHFQQNRLYPDLSEIIDHYRNLKKLRDNSESLKNDLKKDISGIDWQKLELLYKQPDTPDNDLLNELENIINYSLPLFYDKINEGKKIYDIVEQNLAISPVGIVPIRNAEGYMMLHINQNKEVRVYQYQISSIEVAYEKLKQLITRYVGSFEYSVSKTYENIKHHLLLTRKELPNPAVYCINSQLDIPFNETLFPVVKRYFTHKIAA